MLKRISAVVLSFVFIISLLSISVMAAPYKDIKVGTGETVIEAIWFDSGEYFDTDPAGGNHDYRPDEDVQTYDYNINGDYVGGRETDTPSCVGWVNAEEWIQYTIQVEVAGKYQLSAWLAADGASGDLAAYYDGNSIGSVFCDPIGWHEYTLYPVGTVDMTEGTHIIKAEFPDGGINLESLTLTLIEAAAPPVTEPELSPEVQAIAAPVSETPAPAPITAPTTGDTMLIVMAVVLTGTCIISRRVIKNKV